MFVYFMHLSKKKEKMNIGEYIIIKIFKRWNSDSPVSNGL